MDLGQAILKIKKKIKYFIIFIILHFFLKTQASNLNIKLAAVVM
jgi:hypothetical protein